MPDVLGDAWAMVRRDRVLLFGLAGPFWLLPVLALRLLVPVAPPLPLGLEPGSPAATAAARAVIEWAGAHGMWFLVAAGVGALGTVAVFVLYLDRDRPDVAASLARAGRLWPRFVLLNLITALPTGAGLMLLYVPGVYILARVLASGPALVAEAPIGAWAAVGRGFRLSRGSSIALMGVVAVTLALAWIVPQPLLVLDEWLRAQPGGANPVALATVDVLASAIAAAAALASALVAVAAYRRLAR